MGAESQQKGRNDKNKLPIIIPLVVYAGEKSGIYQLILQV